MNYYITFHRVLDLIQQFQTQSPILNTFAYGNLVDFGQLHVSGGTVEYPFLFVVPQSIQYDENTTTYQLSLIFADLLNYDLSNEKDCVSDMSLEARRFLSYLKRGIRTFPDLYDNLDINLPVQAIPFFERFGDHVAGVAVDCNLIIFEDLNACDYYDNTPTPTAEPTSTPSPTPNTTPPASPSATPGVTPTMTMTPSETCDLTVQYLKEELQGSNQIKLTLWNDPTFVSVANATCDLGVSGTYDILNGAIGVSFSTAISNGDHTHIFNTGNNITGFTITNINTAGCTCPTIIQTCRTYNITGLFTGGTFNWYDCDGTTQTSGSIFTTQIICAMEGTVSLIAGNGTITEIGDCQIV